MAVMHFVCKLPIKTPKKKKILIVNLFCVALVNISERFFMWFCLPVDYSWTVYSLRDSLLPVLDCLLLWTDLCKFAA